MPIVLEAVLPIFLVIILGWFVKNYMITQESFWLSLNRLTYWFLLPAFLLYHTSLAELSVVLIKDTLIVLCLSSLIVALITLATCWRYFSARDLSSLLQATCRHNTFVAFVLAELLYGQQGIFYATASTAVLVPFTNVFVILAMTYILNGTSHGELQQKRNSLLKEAISNPFLVSIFLGFVLNFLGLGRIVIFHDTLQLVGRSGLPVMLLCIGAGLIFSNMISVIKPIIISMFGKYVIFPACVMIIGFWVGLPKDAFLVAMIFSCVPTATASYALASQMGGNAYLMANIITAQTLLCLVTIPITLTLAQYIMHLSNYYH